MVLKIDMTGDIPIYQQIRNQIVSGVATGQLKAGEQLPTVRQLAADIGVNPMTVSKAYRLLKDEGVIVMDRRHGAQINSIQSRGNPLDKKFDQNLTLLLLEVRMKGASKEDLLEHTLHLIDKIYGQEEI
jgi:GntR family transcriptional regulator